MRSAILPALIAASFVMPGVAVAETKFVSWQGLWRLNEAKSHYPSGYPVMHDHTIDVTKDDGNILQYTEAGTPDGGPKSTYSFDGAYDGKYYKAGAGQMTAFRHDATDIFHDHWKSKEGAAGQDICSFSADGAHLTCRGLVKAPSGTKLSYFEVWDKVK
jgi:hypothetical protein